jgi:hypothetical protein
MVTRPLGRVYVHTPGRGLEGPGGHHGVVRGHGLTKGPIVNEHLLAHVNTRAGIEPHHVHASWSACADVA